MSEGKRRVREPPGLEGGRRWGGREGGSLEGERSREEGVLSPSGARCPPGARRLNSCPCASGRRRGGSRRPGAGAGGDCGGWRPRGESPGAGGPPTPAREERPGSEPGLSPFPEASGPLSSCADLPSPESRPAALGPRATCSFPG